MLFEEIQPFQPVVLQMLQNSILKDRVAHAYLFEGEKGTRKKEMSMLFAKALLCLNRVDGKPCEDCSNCKRINHGNHPDLHVVEPDGLSIKKDQIKSLQEEFSKTGVESKKKIYIIVHGDKMTANAANSLLKFLEEPLADTTAILITGNIHRILPTILSRCQTVSFKPLPKEQLTQQLLEEGIPPHFATLAANLTNHYEEAVEICQNEWFAQARIIVLKLYEVLQKSPFQAMVKIQEDFVQHFKEKDQVDRALDLLLLIYKDLLHIQLGKEEQLVYPDQKENWKSNALQVSTNRLSTNMTVILEAKRKLNANMNSQLLVEQLMLKLQG
ncbi:DNA polymerase III subunit delta' [Rossellomorea vietnamensis]|uniref:DNA polymerase III subunit delta' n=1 Tax=Rossellomorea vietnamensis TaxID=218284 RepID=A0A6I6UAD8_9BACI|nr:DNA polymerase III subunit delta' [Rossellomorea vietnamensis]QHE59664.1 DNA polymerase III subunit delta' [Rossellomorea vietnamensis]